MVRGVNLGGWLSLEPWITPSVFEGVDEKDEYHIGLKLGQAEGEKYLTKHWSTFYQEEDFARIASWGINLLRIPISYWAFDPDHAPYITGQAQYLDKAVVWARKYNLKILIDLHGVKGGQSGFDNSGQQGVAKWDPANDLSTPLIIGMIAKRYANSSDTVVAIQAVNEPFPPRLLKSEKQIAVYFDRAYTEMRKYSDDIAFWLHDSFTDYSVWGSQFTERKYHTIIQDSHQYEIFDSFQIKNSLECRIASVCTKVLYCGLMCIEREKKH
jgi:glucan 1,3-beta-glucosidase